MNRPIPLLFALLGLWIIGTSFWRYNAGCCQTVAPASNLTPVGAVVPPLKPAPTKAIAIADDATTFNVGLYDNLSFELSNPNFLTPISDSLSVTFVQLTDYLKKNPKRSVQITGLYQSGEENASMLNSLGLGRANQVKKMLVDLGAPEAQIELGDELTGNIHTVESALTNAVNFSFFETPAVDENHHALKERLRANPMLLYFETDAKQLDLSDEQRQFLTDLSAYLSKNPEAIVKSIGHTDDMGDYVRNKYISRKRAEFVRDYLVKNGINEKQIWVFFEGPDLPISDNETMEGRAQNRRVEVTLK